MISQWHSRLELLSFLNLSSLYIPDIYGWPLINYKLLGSYYIVCNKDHSKIYIVKHGFKWQNIFKSVRLRKLINKLSRRFLIVFWKVHNNLQFTYLSAPPLMQIAKSFVMNPLWIVSTQTSSKHCAKWVSLSLPTNWWHCFCFNIGYKFDLRIYLKFVFF